MEQEKNISEKITRLLVWITFLSFTSISLGTAFVVYQLSLNGRLTSLRAATATLAADINGWFEHEMANCTQMAAVMNDLYDFHGGALSADERGHVYEALVARNNQYLDVYDAVGQLEFVSGVGDKPPVNFDATKRSWYLMAMETPGVTVVVPPYIDAIKQIPCMTFAQTIAPDSGKRGVFAMDITLNHIRDYVGHANKEPKSHFFIVDSHGKIIVHPDQALMPDRHGAFSIIPPPLWAKITSGADSILDFDTYGKLVYYVSSSLNSTGWRIVSNVQLQEVVTPIIAVVTLIIAAFAAIIGGIVLILKRRLNSLVSAPLDSLRHIVDKMALGNNDVLIEPERYQAEFRLFAESFKQMCELRYAAKHDSLSGLLNRSAFFSAAERDYALMRRQGTPGCALMMDLDFFKLVNDTHGHSAGDQVIVEVAAMLRERLRTTDLAGRYGGEEFCVWLPNTDRKGGMSLAEELRQGVSDLKFIDELGTSFGVTVSIGLADAVAANIGALLAHADKALYQAKHNGRDRVEVYEKTASGEYSVKST